MTARVGTIAVDGTPISRTDLARIEAEDELHADQARRAVRVVAGHAEDAAECRSLLDMLGLDEAIVLSARRPAAPSAKRSRKRTAA